MVALMPVNLYLEAYKLRVALPRNLRASWRETYGQVCAGIALGLWTPGRVGEFVGRLARTSVAQRGPILAATGLGAIAQWAPLLMGGGLAIVRWRRSVPQEAASLAEGGAFATLHGYLYGDAVWWLGLGSVVLGVLTAGLFFYVTDVLTRLKRVRWPEWAQWGARRLRLGHLVQVEFLAAFRGERFGLFAASVGRYVVYLVQMAAAFLAFGLGVEVGAAILGTAALLLLHGFLPLPAAVHAVARIEFALLLFAYSAPNEVAIAAASLLVFALNLGLPALVGWLFIVRKHDVSPSP